MKTDSELLALAAKAAEINAMSDPNGVWRNCTKFDVAANIFAAPKWSPLTDDGDALRLAVQIGHSRGLTIEIGQGGVCVTFDHPHVFSDGWQGPRNSYDPQSTARRAIVTAAAKIGEQMP